MRLRYVVGQSTKEIAAKLGKTDGAIRVIVNRCGHRGALPGARGVRQRILRIEDPPHLVLRAVLARLASAVHGREAQAESLAWQLDLVTDTGCAGACVFSWTDDWAVNDQPVDGWGFGLTSAHRRPKPALEIVSRWALGPSDS